MFAASVCPRADEIRQFLLGQTPPHEADRIDEHLARCAECLAVAAALRPTDPLLDTVHRAAERGLVGALRVDTELIARLCRLPAPGPAAEAALHLDELLAPAAAPDELGRIGPYGILRVLGRGGMGIVFAARQDQPRRVVALKMLDAGVVPSRERLERFRAESELLARLSHPQVVRVLAVGEHQGRPYFTTEYAVGGSLAQKLAQATLPPRAAAALLMGLARTVAAAHAQGIVHRDLKPSNVLLSSDGTPLIADFGLAKQLPGTDPVATSTLAAQTASGAILGTPGYMAPEQAAGNNAAVGPASDIYALGAILYECLTGRPPFKAATLLETLEQVRSEEPVAPRRLQSGLPRDLETICLCCLAKEPRRRYGSAGALADDLEHFLGGRPIQARRAGALERLLKWARRRPALAAVTAVCVLLLAGLVAGAALYEQRLRAALNETAEQKERADANYREARAALRQILARAGAHTSTDVPRLRELQRAQEQDALAFFLKIAEQQGDDPEVRYDIADAFLEVGVLQAKLGQKQEALASLHKAREAFTALADEFPQELRHRYARTRVLLALATSGLVPRADSMTYLEQARRLTEQALAEEPGHRDFRAAEAGIHLQIGNLQVQAKDAERALEKAVLLYEALSRAQPGERKHRQMLANALANLSRLQQTSGRQPDAAHARAEAVLEQLRREQPDDDATLGTLSGLRINWAYVQMNRGASAAALEALASNVALLTAALRAEPLNALLRDRLLRSHGVRAQILDQQQRHAESADERQRVIALMDDVAAADYQRLFLAMSQAKAKQHTAAIAVIDDWATRVTPATPRDQVVYAASVCCMVLNAVRRDQAVPPAERDALVERSGKQAVALLVRLEERGYFRDPAHVRELTTDPDLQPLQQRADFKKLLSRVTAPAK